MRLSRRHACLALAVAPALSRAQPRATTVGPRLSVTDPLPMPALGRERRLRIYLPPSYDSSPTRRYPVVYFHDGQNVFDDATSYSGEWGADETLDALAQSAGFEAIAVGIDHAGADRLTELNPYDHPRFGPGRGFDYLQWVVGTVKPWIDTRYRTRPEAAQTALIGSSMGGLITQAAMHRHAEVFGLGGVLSPAFQMAPAIFELARKHPLKSAQRVFIGAGTGEGAEMVSGARRMAELLEGSKQGEVRLVVNDAGHNEAAWKALLPSILMWLYLSPVG